MAVGDALNGLSDWSWPPNAHSSRSDFSAFGATQTIHVGSVTTDAHGDNMNKALKLVSSKLIMLVQHQMLKQCAFLLIQMESCSEVKRQGKDTNSQ